MIKEAFLCSALALSSVFGGSDMGKDQFLKEYQWMKAKLTEMYPGYEFKFVPKELNITRISGWERIEGIYWNGHSLFKRAA